MNRHFGDIMQVVTAEEMIVFHQRLPASVTRLERRRKPFWMLFYLLPVVLAQRPSAFCIAFHNVARLFLDAPGTGIAVWHGFASAGGRRN